MNVKNGDNASLLFVRDDGNVGIGTSNPGQKLNVIGNVQVGSDYFQPALPQGLNYRLSVDGQVVAKEIKVSATQGDWADFVFDDNYSLQNLYELEKFIKENKHLPDIPTANDVKKDGIDLAKMQAKLLQKIEELTLYVIKLSKENKQLLQKINNK